LSRTLTRTLIQTIAVKATASVKINSRTEVYPTMRRLAGVCFVLFLLKRKRGREPFSNLFKKLRSISPFSRSAAGKDTGLQPERVCDPGVQPADPYGVPRFTEFRSASSSAAV
jgi:hypothetical protein